MRKLRYEKYSGESFEDALDNLNRNFDEMGIHDEGDILSVTPEKLEKPTVRSSGGHRTELWYAVAVVYWSAAD